MRTGACGDGGVAGNHRSGSSAVAAAGARSGEQGVHAERRRRPLLVHRSRQSRVGALPQGQRRRSFASLPCGGDRPCRRASSQATPPATPPAAAASPAAVAVPAESPPPAAARNFITPAASPPPTAAPARRPTQQQIGAIRAACRSDFISHCSGVQPGGPEALQCLERSKAEVSSRCRTALAAITPGAPAATAPPPAAQPPSPPAESFYNSTAASARRVRDSAALYRGGARPLRRHSTRWRPHHLLPRAECLAALPAMPRRHGRGAEFRDCRISLDEGHRRSSRHADHMAQVHARSWGRRAKPGDGRSVG